MSQSPSTTWGERLLAGLAQRTAMAVVAGVTFAAVAPSLANAAGANVPDPVAVALRSGRQVIGPGDEDKDKAAEEKAKAEQKAKDKAAEAAQEEKTGEETPGHGAIVSTVAQCAPKGNDPLLAAEGSLQRNHGEFVRAAAQGATLKTAYGSFDLATQAGADALCAAVAKARAALPPDAAAKAKGARDKSAEPGARGKGRRKNLRAKD